MRTKRLYAQTATITDINKMIKPLMLNGRKMYPLRSVREALGFSVKSSTSGIHKHYGGLCANFQGKLHVAEEYVKVLMSRTKTRALEQEAKAAKPVLPENFGQMTLNLKGGNHA